MDLIEPGLTPHYIPYVNGADFLIAGLDSIREHAARIVVIDNRDPFTGEPDPATFIPYPVAIWKPDIALPHSQLQNWMMLNTRAMGLPFFTWMHHDCLVIEGSLEKLITLAAQSEIADRRYGVILTKDPTNYALNPWNHVDVLSAIRVEALFDVGGWDSNRFPNYWSDYDCYARLVKAGYEVFQSGLNIIHQNGGSQTAARDASRQFIKDTMWDAWMSLWAERQATLGIAWPPA